jgi:hypothetical protein
MNVGNQGNPIGKSYWEVSVRKAVDLLSSFIVQYQIQLQWAIIHNPNQYSALGQLLHLKQTREVLCIHFQWPLSSFPLRRSHPNIFFSMPFSFRLCSYFTCRANSFVLIERDKNSTTVYRYKFEDVTTVNAAVLRSAVLVMMIFC